MKILNLYAGIGGNRKLWPDGHEITAVEYNPKIAEIYKDFFSNDNVIVGDAHQYLLDHYKEYDFIWSSPPCPTHSCMQRTFVFGEIDQNKNRKAVYPDMNLYQEIILLQNFLKSDAKYCIENVCSYYDPLINPQKAGRHYFWTNFYINDMKCPAVKIDSNLEYYEKMLNINIRNYDFDKDYPIEKVLRNCVYPKLGLHIWNCAFRDVQLSLV